MAELTHKGKKEKKRSSVGDVPTILHPFLEGSVVRESKQGVTNVPPNINLVEDADVHPSSKDYITVELQWLEH